VRAAVLAIVVAVARVAHADDDLAEAKRLEASLEYEKALAIVERLIAHGGAEPDALAELHLIAGRLAAGLDRMPVAEDHFARLLALLPGATLPDGTSPKISAPFYAARARSAALHVAITTNDRLLAIVADPDPLGIVRGIAVHATTADGHALDLIEPRVVHVELPVGARATQIAALDEYGNRLWIRDIAPEPAHPAPPKPEHPIVRAQDDVAFYGRWSTWAIAGGVAAAAGCVCAWRFRTDQNDWNRLRNEPGTDYSQLVALENRGRQWGLAADISFGAAAAAAIAATIAYFTHDEPAQPIGIAPTANGVALLGAF